MWAAMKAGWDVKSALSVGKKYEKQCMEMTPNGELPPADQTGDQTGEEEEAPEYKS